MSYLQDQKPVTLFELGKMRAEGRKIAMLTAYDASFAALLGRAGVDSILIGDSLGNVLQGQKSTLPVTLDMMIGHGAAVVRGSYHSVVVVDMPFGSYEGSPEIAYANAARMAALTENGGSLPLRMAAPAGSIQARPAQAVATEIHSLFPAQKMR